MFGTLFCEYLIFVFRLLPHFSISDRGFEDNPSLLHFYP